VREFFDTGKRSAAADTQPNDCCVWWRCTIICHGQAHGSWLSSKQKKLRRWAPVGTSVQSCLIIKLTCCWKYGYAESSSQCAADSRHCGHEHSLHSDDLVQTIIDDVTKSVHVGCPKCLKNEGLSMHSISWKFEAQEFVCEVYCHRWWDVDTSLWLSLNSKAGNGNMPLLQTVQGATSSGKVVCTIF